MPSYSGRESIYSSKKTADSIYYTAKEIDSEDSDATRPLSASLPRRYIDPWDFENYVYVRRNMEPTFETSISPSPAGEPVSSTFYYIPGETEECRRCCAGLEEQLFSNERYATLHNDRHLHEDLLYSSYTDIETSSNEPSSCESTMSTLQLHTPGGFRVRPLVLPKPLPHLDFPAPPSYDYYEIPSDNNYYSINTTECMECINNDNYNTINNNVPLYATNRRKRRNSCCYGTVAAPPPPNGSPDIVDNSAATRYGPNTNRFGLSKKGLLQIDYSCNWNNLDRYIAK